jgi:short subunit dehydrogenase-like uncharacterized protein
MPRQLMIYGATGYTGALIARAAQERGLRPILAGRSPAKLKDLAGRLGFEYRAVGLDEADRLPEALGDVGVVINAAGPFAMTAGRLSDACLRRGVHYLDVGGELSAFERLHARDLEARSRGVMIMPGVGLVVVASDCLAAHAARRLPGAHRLRIAISRIDYLSRGSVKTVMDLVSRSVAIRRNGAVVSLPVGALERRFDYGRGDRASIALTAPDVLSAFYTTDIPNIEVYYESTALDRATTRALGSVAWLLRTAPWQVLLRAQAELLPEGPSAEQRKSGQRTIIAEVEDLCGRRVRSRLRTPDGYSFTAVSALAVAERVLQGDLAIGFQTPARVYGADFVLGFDRVAREDAGG